MRTLSACLLLLLIINEVNWRIVRPSTRATYGLRTVPIRFDRLELDWRGDGPLRVAGAWRIDSDDPAFGGLSGLAVDTAGLVALTDFGSVVRLPRPTDGAANAVIAELPKGPQTSWLKANWDTEALLADPRGRGWWAAFETPGELWLYDRSFARPLERIDLKRFGRAGNTGVESLAADGDALVAFAEAGGWVLRIDGAEGAVGRIHDAGDRVSDVASVAANRFLAIERQPTWLGFRNSLAEITVGQDGLTRRRSWPIRTGRFDNFEGLAVERLGGKLRLWLVTDDNFQKPFRTVLLALDFEASAVSR